MILRYEAFVFIHIKILEMKPREGDKNGKKNHVQLKSQ